MSYNEKDFFKYFLEQKKSMFKIHQDGWVEPSEILIFILN